MLPSEVLEQLRTAITETRKYVGHSHKVQGDFTDFCARLNVLTSDLSEINKDAKAEIEVFLLESDLTVSEGHQFFCNLTRLEVSRLNTPKVKDFLGKKLSQFQVISSETRLTFKIKG